ncbi:MULTISPECIES: CopG family transcriptional regulator [unclassified Aureimonas]|uniref:CopG family transcriptional regulator n=1 Tax=unclassified Aureimonas TaxID=2615206 RepID=UPI000ADCDBAC|nr:MULTISPECIES: CopG family transcriptional regulator [unclassified Aureimonas]
MRDVSVHLSDTVGDGVSRLATAIGRSPDWVIERALTAYLAGEGADLLAAAKGDSEFAEGEAEDFDDVLADLAAIVHGKAA